MTDLKMHILEKAIKIIREDIDTDLHEWLLVHTGARPKATIDYLSVLIRNLKRYEKHVQKEK